MNVRPAKIAVLLLLVLAIIACLYGARVIHQGFKAKDQPSAIETLLARTTRNLAIPASASSELDPIPPTPENVTEGREHFAEGRDHFADHCAICHANNGSGQTEIGQNLYPKVPDMRGPRTQNL